MCIDLFSFTFAFLLFSLDCVTRLDLPLTFLVLSRVLRDLEKQIECLEKKNQPLDKVLICPVNKRLSFATNQAVYLFFLFFFFFVDQDVYR